MKWHELIIREMDKRKKNDLLQELMAWLDMIMWVVREADCHIVYTEDEYNKYYMIIPRDSAEIKEYGKVMGFALRVGEDVLHIGVEMLKEGLRLSVDIHLECNAGETCKIEYDNEIVDISYSMNVAEDKVRLAIKHLFSNK